MKVLVVGLGSMGKRRIRLMQAFFGDIVIAGVDDNQERRRQAAELFSVQVYDCIGLALASFMPDAGFVCAPPSAHADIIKSLLNHGAHVFSEINLTGKGYEENIALAKKSSRVLFLSSTPMYRAEIEYITGRAAGKSKLIYRYHVGQYLPDWHPWEKYTDFFVKDKETNACRELFAIELPWMIKAFGNIVRFSSESKKLTGLTIDYPDCYILTMTHESGAAGQLIIDVVSRKAIRELEIFAEELYLRWGGTPDSLYDYDIVSKQDIKVECYENAQRDNRYAENIIENAYVEEIIDFFSRVDGKSSNIPPKHCFEADIDILKLIDEIEGTNT